MKWSRLDSWHIFLACYLLPILSMRWNLPSLVRVVALDYPLQTIILAFLLPILALAFTRPTSPARLAIIPVIAAAVVSYLQTAHMYISNNMLIAISSGPTTLLLLSSIDYLCLQELHRTKDGKEKSGNIEPQSHITSEKEAIPEPRADLFVDVHHALWWSTDVIFNYRGVGTARQVKNLPTFSRSDPDYVPSRSRFLFRRLVSVALGYIVVDFLNSQPPLNVNLFSASKARLFGGLLDLSLEDVAMRVATTLVFWLSLRLTIALIYNAASALFVGFWLSDPEQWPPYFGSVSDAYSVRRFWGVYWQQSLRNMLVGNAKFWTHGALRQPKGTVIARYLNILFPFFISGILHTILDVCGGVPAAETGAYMFFVLQAFAIMFEDGVEELYRRLGFTRMTKDSGPAQGGERQFNGTKPFLWQKLIGYGWVALFMVWTTPGWSYANIRNADPTVNYLLPFSLVTWARGQQTA